MTLALRALGLLALPTLAVAAAGEAPTAPPPVVADTVIQLTGARLLPNGLTPSEKQQVFRIALALQGGYTQEARRIWETLLGHLGARTPRLREPLAEYILFRSYIETDADLNFRADRVRYFDAQAEAVREHIQALEEALASLAGQEPAAEVTVPTLRVFRQYRALSPPSERTPQEPANREKLEGNLALWRETLAAIGEDARRARAELDGFLAGRQQTLASLAEASALLREAASAGAPSTDGP